MDERRRAGDDTALDEPDAPTDPTRRQFFRTLGRQTAAGAGTAVRSVDALRRGGSAAAGELLGLGVRAPAASAARLGERVSVGGLTAPAGSRDGFSSPYRYTGDSLVVLDRRLFPEQRSTIVLREPSEVAAAMRGGVVGGPVLAELTAYAILLAAQQAWPRGATARAAAIGAAANTLREAAGATQAVRWAADHMATASGDIEALRATADGISSRAATDHARLGRLAAQALPRTSGRDLELVLHGDMGPLSCGLVGTGFAAVQAAIADGGSVHVWLTDGGPDGEGRRITAPQLAQLDVPHTVVPDAAAGWLFANRHVDAVLVRGDWVRPNADTATPIGGLGLAQLAGAAGVPVMVCATRAAYDGAGAAADSAGAAAGSAPVRESDAPPTADPARLEPTTDVVPVTLIASFLTEHGPLLAPFERSLAGAFGPPAAAPSPD